MVYNWLPYAQISIHALLAESDSSIEEVSKYVVISIHALLAESDGCAWVQEFPELYISIHALLAESDHAPSQHPCPRSKFLSTLSLRRATDRVFPEP